MTLSVCPSRFRPERYEEYRRLSESVKYGVALHPIWLSTYLEAFGVRDHELMLDVRDETGTLHGVLALYRKDSRESRFLTQRRLVPIGYGPSDFFGIPSTPGLEGDVAIALSEWLRRNTRIWDQVVLNLLPDDSRVPELVGQRLDAAGFHVVMHEDDDCWVIDASGSFERYVAMLGSAKRRYLRVHRDKLAGRSRVEHLTRGTAQYFDEFLTLYQRRRSMLGQADPYARMTSLDEFFRAVVPQFEGEGALLFSRLLIDDRLAACSYCLAHGGVLYYYMPAIDDDCREYAPGMLLLAELIRHAFEHPGIAEFNFGRSDQAYKRWFRPTAVSCRTITIDNSESTRGRALRLLKRIRAN